MRVDRFELSDLFLKREIWFRTETREIHYYNSLNLLLFACVAFSPQVLVGSFYCVGSDRGWAPQMTFGIRLN